MPTTAATAHKLQPALYPKGQLIQNLLWNNQLQTNAFMEKKT